MLKQFIKKIVYRVLSPFVSQGLVLLRPNNPAILWRELHKRAMHDTVDFIREHMKTAVFAEDKKDVLLVGLDQRPKGCVIAEFGVFKGESINYMANKVGLDETVHGFDSFTGLPGLWTGYIFGQQLYNCNNVLPKVSQNVKLHVGLYEDILTDAFKQFDQPIGFLHIDCDLYSSTKTVLDAASFYIKEEAIIVFDEFFNYPNYQEHEFKAFYEFVETYKYDFQFLAFSSNAVAIKIVKQK